MRKITGEKSIKKIVLLPTYNEVENIPTLLPLILKQDKNIDILVIDDNSPDGTGEIVDKLVKKNARINVIHRKGKLGIGSAYIAGFKYALKNKYDLVFQMDSDFSHDPKYLPKLIAKSANYDLVIGSRWRRGGGVRGWPWYRFATSFSANVFTRFMLDLKPRDVTSGFRCYHREVLENIELDKIKSSSYAILEELIYNVQKGGFSIGEVPIVFVDRKLGQSKMGKKDIIDSFHSIWKLFWEMEKEKNSLRK